MNETIDGTRELLKLREQIKSMTPADQLRIAAGLIEHGKYSLAEAVAEKVVTEHALLRDYEMKPLDEIDRKDTK